MMSLLPNGGTMGRDSAPHQPDPDPHDEAEVEQDEGPIGGEIHVAGGGVPQILRWFAYLMYVWAVVYLVVHPSVPHREVILISAALIGAWLLFFALTKRPPEL